MLPHSADQLGAEISLTELLKWEVMVDPLSHDPCVISGIFFLDLCSRVNSKQMLLNNCLSILINKKVQKLHFWTFWAPTPPGGVHELKRLVHALS